MASLMTMNFNQFVTDFLTNYDYTKYDIIVISRDLCTHIEDDENKFRSKYDNIDFASKLYPLPVAMGYMAEHKLDSFKEAYMNQLDNTYMDISLNLWAIADLIITEKRDVILLCSEVEYKYRYLDFIVEYLDTNFKLPGITYEEFKKYDGNDTTIDFEEAVKVLTFRKELLEQDHATIVYNRFTESLVDRFRDILLSKSIQELRDFAKSKGLFVKRTQNVEDMVEYILDKLYKDAIAK